MRKVFYNCLFYLLTILKDFHISLLFHTKFIQLFSPIHISCEILLFLCTTFSKKDFSLEILFYRKTDTDSWNGDYHKRLASTIIFNQKLFSNSHERNCWKAIQYSVNIGYKYTIHIINSSVFTDQRHCIDRKNSQISKSNINTLHARNNLTMNRIHVIICVLWIFFEGQALAIRAPQCREDCDESDLSDRYCKLDKQACIASTWGQKAIAVGAPLAGSLTSGFTGFPSLLKPRGLWILEKYRKTSL